MHPANVHYAEIAAAVEAHGFVLRGYCHDDGDTVVIVGNVSTTMWPHFEADQRDHFDPNEPNPLDAWTRRCLQPIAARFGAEFVHPSDEPFRPFQRWAQQAESVWPSPIGLLIHPQYGLWHAYRGAFVFPGELDFALDPHVSGAEMQSPCVSCRDRPCLSACPVDAFDATGYHAAACRSHVLASSSPDCLHQGCAARCACPVGADFHYGPAQMFFHMKAFAGVPSIQSSLHSSTDRPLEGDQ